MTSEPQAGPHATTESLLAGCLIALGLAALASLAAPAAQAAGVAPAPTSTTPGSPAASPPPALDAAELTPGAVVARGEPTDAGCRFADAPRIRLAPPELGHPAGAYVDLAADGECRMVVQDVGPTHPPLPELGADGHSRSDDPDSDPDPGSDGSSSGDFSTAATTRTVKTHVIHYGDGGKDDELTEKRQWIEYSWDGNEATIVDHAGSCWWVSGWVNDECALDGVISPADPASRASHGDFHRDGLFVDEYYHTLEAYTYAYGDGSYWCDYNWSGDLVNGISMDCFEV